MSWRVTAYRPVQPVLFRFEPERIHRLTLDALRVAGGNPLGRGVAALFAGVPSGIAPVEVAGVRFRSRVGAGAGFDKNGIALRGWAALGLGFVEVGTVTPLPQPGTRRPRLFRLGRDEALINRMGFNNAGAAAVARNVMLARRHLPAGFVVGVNLGRGRSTSDEQAVEDYRAAHRLLAPVADYLVVNVSSPNTPGLRALQAPGRLRQLLDMLDEAGDRLSVPRPLFVKLAPNLPDEELDRLIEALADSPAAGLVLANTTVARPSLESPPHLRDETGGLSGAPLLPRTVAMVRHARRRAGERLAIIASGGIRSGEDGAILREAGADLVQLWTGLVYRGPGLIGEVSRAA
jgi:dihydroorotate dehydrogenase